MLSERGVFRRMDPSGQDAVDDEIMGKPALWGGL